MNDAREKAKQVHAAIKQALQGVELHHGVKFTYSSMTFDQAGGLSIRIKGGVAGPNGQVASPEANNFKLMAGSYGLDPAMLGKTFAFQGKTFTLTGLSPRSPKRPILASSGGKTYKFPADMVKLLCR